MRRVATVLHRFLAVVAVLCLGTWTAVKLYAFVAIGRNEAMLDRLIHDHQAGRLGPGFGLAPGAAGSPAEGALLGRLDIPRLGVSAMILEGTGERSLEQGAGHIPGTALPGAAGNVAIAGHRDSFFRGLRMVDLADVITLTTPSVTRRYAVDSFLVVDPTDTRVLAPSSDAQLTLITCFPFNFVGPAPHRFVVRAHAIALDEGASAKGSGTSRSFRWAPAPRRRTLTRPGRQTARKRRAGARSAHQRDAVAQKAPERQSPLQQPPPRKRSWWKRLFHIGAHSVATLPP